MTGVCEIPTPKNPDGRTGLTAGYLAHNKAGEPVCEPCQLAHLEKGRKYWANLSLEKREERRKQNREERARYRANSPELAKLAKRRYMDTNRSIIRDAKSVPCADCGVTYPYYVMQFDHLDDKEFNIGVFGPTGSRKRLIAEMAKCEVVCANCHAERTHRRHLERRANEAS